MSAGSAARAEITYPAGDLVLLPGAPRADLEAQRSRRNGLVVLGLLVGLVLLLGTLRGATRPFWFDEIATVDIAGAPTWHETLRLSRKVDLHPPLEPALVRLSFDLLGRHEFAGRLPSILAFAAGVGSLFLFLRRRVSLVYACFGALLPLCNADVAAYLTEARPYALLFGATCAGVLAYDTLLRKQYPVASRVVLAICLTTLLQSHLFGVFAAGAFVLAEAVRSMRLRRVDWATWAAVLLPWCSCVTYIPLLRSQVTHSGSPMIYEPKDRTSLLKGLFFYHQFVYLPLAPLTKVIAVVLLCAAYFPARSFVRFSGLSAELGALLLGLLITPVLVTLLLNVRAPESGFYPRYAIAAVGPAFLLFTTLVAWRAGPNRYVAAWMLTAVAVGSAVSFADAPAGVLKVARFGLLAAPPEVGAAGGVEALCPRLPIVINDAQQFLEADNRLPVSAVPQMIYLSDPAESLRLEHENASQAVEGLSQAFGRPHHVLPAEPFLAEHPQFLLLERPGHTAWLSDRLREQHARVQDLGSYRFAGRTSELEAVSQDGQELQPSPGCTLAAPRGDALVASRRH